MELKFIPLFFQVRVFMLQPQMFENAGYMLEDWRLKDGDEHLGASWWNCNMKVKIQDENAEWSWRWNCNFKCYKIVNKSINVLCVDAPVNNWRYSKRYK